MSDRRELILRKFSTQGTYEVDGGRALNPTLDEDDKDIDGGDAIFKYTDDGITFDGGNAEK